MPKTALKASACAPLPFVAAEAAVLAVAHVALAVASAAQELVKVSQMNSIFLLRKYADRPKRKRTGDDVNVLSRTMVVGSWTDG